MKIYLKANIFLIALIFAITLSYATNTNYSECFYQENKVIDVLESIENWEASPINRRGVIDKNVEVPIRDNYPKIVPFRKNFIKYKVISQLKNFTSKYSTDKYTLTYKGQGILYVIVDNKKYFLNKTNSKNIYINSSKIILQIEESLIENPIRDIKLNKTYKKYNESCGENFQKNSKKNQTTSGNEIVENKLEQKNSNFSSAQVTYNELTNQNATIVEPIDYTAKDKFTTTLITLVCILAVLDIIF